MLTLPNAPFCPNGVTEKAREILCTGCHASVAALRKRNLRWLNGRIYHAECLCCSVCRVDMKSENMCFVKDRLLLCYADYSRHYGEICPKCARGFQLDDMVRAVTDKKYHTDCFSCDICNRQLLTGEKFKYKGGYILCETHSNESVTELRFLPRTREPSNHLVASLPPEQICDSRLMQSPETSSDSGSMMSTKPYMLAADPMHSAGLTGIVPLTSGTLLGSRDCGIQHIMQVPQETLNGLRDGGGQYGIQVTQKQKECEQMTDKLSQKPNKCDQLSSEVSSVYTLSHNTGCETTSPGPDLTPNDTLLNFTCLTEDNYVNETESQKKKRRKRTLITEEQLRVLEDWYTKSKYIEMTDMENISDVTGLTLKSIKIWFQNKRRLDKVDNDMNFNNGFTLNGSYMQNNSQFL